MRVEFSKYTTGSQFFISYNMTDLVEEFQLCCYFNAIRPNISEDTTNF